MLSLQKGRHAVREATSPADLDAVMALRRLCFRADAAPDGDAQDARCRHVLVSDLRDGAAVAAFRLFDLAGGAGIADSYAAQHYDLTALAGYDRPMLEMGRFCIRPDRSDPDILRLAWGALARAVDAGGIGMLFGCTSFRGTDPAPYDAAFAALARAHLAPPVWAPRPRAARIVPFVARAGHDPRRAALGLPPLLRSYLAMGGWVSDHAVIDADLGTLHVFTALEVAALPPARARALRAIAG